MIKNRNTCVIKYIICHICGHPCIQHRPENPPTQRYHPPFVTTNPCSLQCSMEPPKHPIQSLQIYQSAHHVGVALKMVGFPNNQCFPTKNDHFGVFWGYHHLRKHPCLLKHHISFNSFFLVSFFWNSAEASDEGVDVL